jgi:TfoX/Sxy family transcriptional regulator of competence genes
MNKHRFKPDHKDVLDTLLLGSPNVRLGQMFGSPAYYVNNKMFACLFVDGVILKLPEPIAKHLVQQDSAQIFESNGRKMREWVKLEVQVAEDYIQHQELFSQSIEFVEAISQT